MGYYDGYFYLSHTGGSNGVQTYMVMNFEYGDSYAFATFTIEEYGIKMFEADLLIYFSNHRYKEMIIDEIIVSYYTTDDQLDLVAALMVMAATFSVNNASDYLNSKGLPYLY